MLNRSLARGIAQMTLRDIAEAGTITHRPLDGVRLPKGRKGRVLVMDVRLRQLRPLLLYEEHDDRLGYGGAVAYVHFATAGERSITLKSEAIGVRRFDETGAARKSRDDLQV